MEIIDRFRPAPCVIEGHPLRSANEGIVESFGIEGRIEIDQVYRFIGNVFPHDIKAVPEVEFIGGGGWGQHNKFSKHLDWITVIGLVTSDNTSCVGRDPKADLPFDDCMCPASTANSLDRWSRPELAGECDPLR